MAHKKPKKYRAGKKQYIVHSKGPIIPIDEWPNPGFGIIKKPTLHSGGGLITGIPKLTTKGWK